MITENLNAYAMYNMGADIWRNEIAHRGSILNRSNGKYKVFPVKVIGIKEDEYRGELEIGLEKVILDRAKVYGKNYKLTFFSEDAVEDFFDDTDVDKAADLLNRILIGLFTNANNLKWLIAYPISITKDDVNITKIDAGDFSYLND